MKLSSWLMVARAEDFMKKEEGGDPGSAQGSGDTDPCSGIQQTECQNSGLCEWSSVYSKCLVYVHCSGRSQSYCAQDEGGNVCEWTSDNKCRTKCSAFPNDSVCESHDYCSLAHKDTGAKCVPFFDQLSCYQILNNSDKCDNVPDCKMASTPGGPPLCIPAFDCGDCTLNRYRCGLCWHYLGAPTQCRWDDDGQCRPYVWP